MYKRNNSSRIVCICKIIVANYWEKGQQKKGVTAVLKHARYGLDYELDYMYA